jgi:hypothetical protein
MSYRRAHWLPSIGSSEPSGDGLALFSEQGSVRQFRVPLWLAELVAVSDRFLIRPLLPLLGAAGHF